MLRYKLFVISLALTFLASLPAHAKQLPSIDKIHISKVLIVVAMDTEAKPIISSLNLHKMTHSFPQLPMQGYVGKYKKLDILLITNGIDPVNHVQNIGTQAATLSAYLGVTYFHPDLIISIGTAGGVGESGAKQRDIYASQKIYFFDRRIPLKGYHEYGLGGYQSVNLSGLEKKVGLKSGIICSGNSFDENQTDYNMFLKYHCSAIEMEAAGVAWVSMLTKTPMFAMKGVTNLVRGRNIHKQYQDNIANVSIKLTGKLKETLNYISSNDKMND